VCRFNTQPHSDSIVNIRSLFPTVNGFFASEEVFHSSVVSAVSAVPVQTYDFLMMWVDVTSPDFLHKLALLIYVRCKA
jgi:hypothetical protein